MLYSYNNKVKHEYTHLESNCSLFCCCRVCIWWGREWEDCRNRDPVWHSISRRHKFLYRYTISGLQEDCLCGGE